MGGPREESCCSLRPPNVPILALAALALAALSPATLHATVAGTAAILFEATPFVLGAALAERALTGWVRQPATPALARVRAAVTAVIGCGCGGRLGGTLSIPAFGLCWLTFGPLVAGLKVALGLTVAVCLLRRCDDVHPVRSLDELRALVPSAALAAFLAGALAALPPNGLSSPLALTLGLFAGALAPCATGAIALAGALRGTLPSAAFGLLAAAGLPLSLAMPTRARAGRSAPAPVGHLLLALACAWLTVRGGAGFVSPRLLPLIVLGMSFALVTAALDWRGAARELHRGAFVPGLLLIALVAGSPAPAAVATETTLSDAFPGERVVFTGTAQSNGGATVLVRYAITCCRADAAPVAVRLARKIPVPTGTWLNVSGTMQRRATGLVLDTEAVRPIVPPADPFVYR